MSTSSIPARRRGCRYFGNLLIGFVFALIVVYNCVVPVFISYKLSRMRSPVGNIDRSKLSFPIEDVSFTTSDGIKISAWYSPSQNRGAIILVHGSTGNRTATLLHARLLTEAGYGVLMLDLRGNGDSGGEFFTMGWDSDLDLRAAVDYLQNRPDVDPDKIGALGLSMGAEVVLQSAAGDDRIKAIVSDGAGFRTPGDILAVEDNSKWFQLPFIWMQFTSLSLMTNTPMAASLIDLIPKIAPRPLLLIYGTQGNIGERLLTEVYGRAAGQASEVWRLDGMSHIAGVIVRADDYREKVVNFFTQALLNQVLLTD
ncbi:MAG TPA: alpha/beta fold hydrolase [Phototrophicaceae bacterium]|jgi:fermentation-respiration switch protein FrsA (DUF1100 family)|nr:alpha/beta fold hydrolase [Phototrophicaceae bacterium]